MVGFMDIPGARAGQELDDLETETRTIARFGFLTNKELYIQETLTIKESSSL